VLASDEAGWRRDLWRANGAPWPYHSPSCHSEPSEESAVVAPIPRFLAWLGMTRGTMLVGDYFSRAFLLRLGQGRRHILERCQMRVDICFRVLNRNRPLFVPPIRLGHHTAVDHCEPVVAPQIDVDGCPIAVVANLPRIEHQSPVRAGARDVALQSDLSNRLAIAIGQLRAELIYVRIVFTTEDVAKSCQP